MNKKKDYSYYMSQAEKDVFGALDGDKDALKRIQEGPGLGFVVCPKCKEKFYIYRSDLK